MNRFTYYEEFNLCIDKKKTYMYNININILNWYIYYDSMAGISYDL